jgi:hypothetical protein
VKFEKKEKFIVGQKWHSNNNSTTGDNNNNGSNFDQNKLTNIVLQLSLSKRSLTPKGLCHL